jgi:hypothetical protein
MLVLESDVLVDESQANEIALNCAHSGDHRSSRTTGGHKVPVGDYFEATRALPFFTKAAVGVTRWFAQET